MTNEEAIKIFKEVREEVIAKETELSRQVFENLGIKAIDLAIKALEQQPCEDCISRKQTLKAFAEECAGECACCEYNGSGYDTAENCKLIKSLPSVTPQQTTWIPLNAKGNEPKEEGRYLLCLNDNYIDVVYYAGQAWNFWFGIGQKPIAYMPLPEPYTESEE